MNQPVKTLYPDEIVIDLRTSCSKDEAAAKLLGWLRGPIYPKYIKVTSGAQEDAHASGSISDKSASNSLPYRIEEHELKNLHSLECTLGGSLQSQLKELHESARLEFSDALVEPDLEIKANAVLYWERQIRQAAAYLRDIDDELANEDDSELKIDKAASTKAEEPQILLNSLDRWAKRKYGIFIFIDNDMSSANSFSSNEDQQAFRDKELSEEKELNSLAATNLYATLALLAEDYAKKTPGLMKKNETLNILAIAEEIEKLAIKKTINANNPSGDYISGLRKGVIDDRLKEAFKRLKEKI